MYINFPHFSPGAGDVQRWLEQSVWAHRVTHPGRVYPALPAVANWGSIPGEHWDDPGPTGLPAYTLQPVWKPRHEYCSLPGLCGRPQGGVSCCQGSLRWELTKGRWNCSITSLKSVYRDTNKRFSIKWPWGFFWTVNIKVKKNVLTFVTAYASKKTHKLATGNEPCVEIDR